MCWSRVRYENAAWSSMCVPDSACHINMFWSVPLAKIQGINRSARVLVSKWDTILHPTKKGQWTDVLVQQTWGSPSPQGSRNITGFWSSPSEHQGIGTGLEIWVMGPGLTNWRFSPSNSLPCSLWCALLEAWALSSLFIWPRELEVRGPNVVHLVHHLSHSACVVDDWARLEQGYSDPQSG